MAEAYPWLKAFHIVAVIAWMAGLFYLPRLFVYHSRSTPGSEMSETFKIMEERLARIIMRPAAMLSWALGLLLLAALDELRNPPIWVVAKVSAVVLLTVFHIVLERNRAAFAMDARPHSERYFRAINEIPTVLLTAIVILVVVKPWS